MNYQKVYPDTGILPWENHRKKCNLFIMLNIYHTQCSWFLATKNVRNLGRDKKENHVRNQTYREVLTTTWVITREAGNGELIA